MTRRSRGFWRKPVALTGLDWRLLAAPLAAAACSNGPSSDSATANGDPVGSERTASIAAAQGPNDAATAQEAAGPTGVANLPYARGAVFATLDDYLAYLEKQGAIDLPWWREIAPGTYERVVRMPEAPREVKTRAELMELYGFER